MHGDVYWGGAPTRVRIWRKIMIQQEKEGPIKTLWPFSLRQEKEWPRLRLAAEWQLNLSIRALSQHHDHQPGQHLHTIPDTATATGIAAAIKIATHQLSKHKYTRLTPISKTTYTTINTTWKYFKSYGDVMVSTSTRKAQWRLVARSALDWFAHISLHIIRTFEACVSVVYESHNWKKLMFNSFTCFELRCE